MMNRFLQLLLVPLFTSAFLSCVPSDKSGKQASALSFLAPKDKQYTVWELPDELKEVSGVIFKDSVNVLAVEDEDGLIYQYNLRDKKIVSKTRFAGEGDYEDLTIVGNDVYVVNSAGDLFRIRNFLTGKNISIFKLLTPLKKKNDVEGLCYDQQKGRLLLAAKAKGLINKKTKEIFAFNLKTNQLDTVPARSMPLAAIEAYYKGDAIEESSKKFLKALGNKNMSAVFTTSALAVHPKTQHLYLLSSVNDIIAVLDSNDNLLRVIPLKGKIFIQPEGLAFSPDGKLYVSNEGKKKYANIIRLENEN